MANRREQGGDTFEWVAKLVEKSTAAANNVIAQLQNSLDSALSNLDKANQRTNEAHNLLHSQAKVINELQQKDLDREKFLAEIGVLQHKMNLDAERNKALISSVKDVGRVLVQSAMLPGLALPPAMDGSQSKPNDASECDQWAFAVWSVFTSLSEETRKALAQEAGEDKVQALMALLIARKEKQDKEQGRES